MKFGLRVGIGISRYRVWPMPFWRWCVLYRPLIVIPPKTRTDWWIATARAALWQYSRPQEDFDSFDFNRDSTIAMVTLIARVTRDRLCSCLVTMAAQTSSSGSVFPLQEEAHRQFSQNITVVLESNAEQGRILPISAGWPKLTFWMGGWSFISADIGNSEYVLRNLE